MPSPPFSLNPWAFLRWAAKDSNLEPADYKTVPMLAEEFSASTDGLTATITLRTGVPFHNGEEMTAGDVVASFNRWAPVSALGLAVSPFLESISEVDASTVEIKLNSPLTALPSMLARQAQGLSIHPKSIIDAAGTNPLGDTGYIGTGPYQFVERQADRYTRLKRFENYAALDTPASAYSGNKAANEETALCGHSTFMLVPWKNSRHASWLGLEATDLHDQWLDDVEAQTHRARDGFGRDY